MIKNIYQVIWDLNQWQLNYNWRCSLFSFAHNLLWNTWIWLDYKDIEEIAKICKDKWLLTDDKWWYSKCFEIAFDFIKEKNLTPKIRMIKTNTWTSTYQDLIKNNYAVRIWIWINKIWYTDIRSDWDIDTINYNDIKWDYFKHFLNYTVANTNWLKWEVLIDNYFWKHKSIIKDVKLNELEKIMYPTVYAVISQ